jgi:hypothetical protein
MKTRIVQNGPNEPGSREFSATPQICPAMRSIAESGAFGGGTDEH